jgi:hypothetical protein
VVDVFVDYLADLSWGRAASTGDPREHLHAAVITKIRAGAEVAVYRCARMPTYRISIVNEHFAQTAEQEASDVTKAWQKAIASAVTIAADQVSHGNPFFGAEVTLDQGNKRIGRYVVSVGASPLKD